MTEDSLRNPLEEARRLKDEGKDYKHLIEEASFFPKWRFAEVLSEEGFVEEAGEVSERAENYVQAAGYYSRVGDMFNSERCLKLDASMRKYGMVVPTFEHDFLAGRDYPMI